MPIKDRLLAALRARFVLHIWWCHVQSMASGYPDLVSTQRSFISAASFKILNRLCDTMVLLGLVYAEHYPEQPFCLWLLGTNLLKHFFGTARSLVPNFTYPELLKLVKHIMLRQQYLLAHKNSTEKKERTARAGYILDYDNTPLSPDELEPARVQLEREDLNKLVELAATEAKAICTSILKMRTPRAPWSLASISTPLPRYSPNHQTLGLETESYSSDGELEPDSYEDVKGIVSESDEGSIPGGSDSPDHDSQGLVNASGSLSERVTVAAYETGRLLALSEDYEATVGEVEKFKGERGIEDLLPLTASGSESKIVQAREDQCAMPPGKRTAWPKTLTAGEESPLDSDSPVLRSAFISASGEVSIRLLVALREKHQEGARVRSQRIVQVDQKFNSTDATASAQPSCNPLDSTWALRQWQEVERNTDSDGGAPAAVHGTSGHANLACPGETVSTPRSKVPKGNMTAKEASHRVRVVQQLHGKPLQESNARLARWTEVAKGIQRRVPMLGMY